MAEPTPSLDDVCSLPPADREARLAWMRREILPRALRREPREDGVSLVFRYDPDLERTLTELVAFERRCCGGLSWDTHREGRTLRLTVLGLGAGAARWLDGRAAPGTA